MHDEILNLFHGQSLKLIRLSQFIFICSVLSVGSSIYAEDSARQRSPLNQGLIGIWQNGVLSLDLKANGELILKQNLVAIEAQSSGRLIEQSSHKDFKKDQTYLGYWWSTAHRLCFLLDLSSQCMSYRLKQGKALKDKTARLQIQLGQQWAKFIKNESSQTSGSVKVPSKPD